MTKKIAVVGGSGYTGLELLRLLSRHPHVEVTTVCSRSDSGNRLDARFPSLRGLYALRFSNVDIALLKKNDLVFFATPNGVAMHSVPELLGAGVKVIDLSADFRLTDAEQWQHWYAMEHACPQLLQDAVYGLPELDSKNAIADARLVANPGCYATAAQLSLAAFVPLADKLAVEQIIVDGKSGVSGAGRALVESSLFAQAGENLSAYKIHGHRHMPEVVQQLRNIQPKTSLCFVPHLIPMVRGILTTAYIPCLDTSFDFLQQLTRFYDSRAFVDVLDAPATMETKSVSGSNICRVSCYLQNDTLLSIAVIDNLVKGAAGQAIQNMNIMCGFEETCGLNQVAQYP